MNPACMCPSCNADLREFDAVNAAKNVVLAGLVDSFLAKTEEKKNHHWSCSLTPISDSSDVCELRLELENSKFSTRPSLFIAVLDGSGSMSSRPMTQVSTALKHIVELSRLNNKVKLVMIKYGSGAEEIETADQYGNTGGTNFRAAFACIESVLRRYICSDRPEDANKLNNVSAVDIAFLTDGEDMSGNRERLVPELKEMLEVRWGDHPLRIHAIGFSQGCDRGLLDSMRTAGSLEGVFRYAEPDDNDDALCQKLTSVFEFASKASTVPISLKIDGALESVRFPVDSRGYGKFTKWVKLEQKMDLSLTSPCDENIHVEVDVRRPSDMVLQRWLAHQVDVLAEELLKVSERKLTERVRKLYCSLLQAQVDAISAHSDGSLEDRLVLITEQVDALRAGTALNLGKLSDLRFSSLFGQTHKANVKIRTLPPPEFKEPLALPEKPYNEQPLKRYSRNHAFKNRNVLQRAIMDHFSDKFLSDDLREALSLMSREDVLYKDVNGNNALMLAAYCGHSKVVKDILEKFEVPLEEENEDGETAVTLAIKKHGYHHTLGVLLDSGAVIPRRKSIERFAIDNGYTITAEIISNYGDGKIEVDETMTDKYVKFMYQKAKGGSGNFDVNRFLKVCLAKGLDEEAKELLEEYKAEPSLQMLLDHCIPKKPDAPDTDVYLTRAKMLVEARPGLLKEHTEPEQDTALITATRKGSLPHVKYFLSKGAELEATNEKGNTAFWVASFMRYPCIMEELMMAGANINHANLKGNVPLYGPCCRGNVKIAEMLIAWGADIERKNTNGDTHILLCCRNGQHEMLAYLLGFVDTEFANFKAHIDGFNAIMASAEQDRPECIRVLREYGIDLNQKTDEDNAILGSATPLHIACYYGRVNAVRELVRLGANCNVQDVNGSTPLHLAVIQGYVEIIKLLRDKTDSTLIDNAGNPPMAYCRDRTEIRKVLVNPMLDSLMCLAKGGFEPEEEKEAVEMLGNFHGVAGCLSTKDVVDVPDFDGSTPLQHAVIFGKRDLVRVLMDKGADSTRKNRHGMNAIVWAQWLHNPRVLDLVRTEGADLDSVELDLLNATSKQNRKNAMLMFLGRPPTKYELYPRSGIDQRMDLFVNTPFNPSILEDMFVRDLRMLETKNAMVQRYFQTRESGFDSVIDSNLLWLSKMFVINKIGGGERVLTPHEIMALCMYTNNAIVPRVINQRLLESSLDGVIKEYVGVLNQALRKLPVFEGEVFLGSASVDRTLFQKGREFVWQHLVSGSTMWRVALENCPQFTTKARKGVIFIIKSKTGRIVAPYSQFSFDSEVIFLPHTRFKVTNWYHGDVIALGQENIREHTFGVKERDDERLCLDELKRSDKALIVELEELSL